MAFRPIPTTKYGSGVPTDPAHTVGTQQKTIWDTAVGTSSGVILNHMLGNTDETYWGTSMEELVKAVQSETDVTKRVTALSKAKTHGYIKNIDTGEIRKFQFNPEQFKYSRGVNYTDNVAPGMAYPRTQFVAGKTREFTVELFMYDRQLEPCGIIKNYICFFGQFLTPEENVEEWKRPPQMLFLYGYFVRKCVLTDLDITIDDMDESGTPTMAHISLTLRQIGVV